MLANNRFCNYPFGVFGCLSRVLIMGLRGAGLHKKRVCGNSHHFFFFFVRNYSLEDNFVHSYVHLNHIRIYSSSDEMRKLTLVPIYTDSTYIYSRQKVELLNNPWLPLAFRCTFHAALYKFEIRYGTDLRIPNLQGWNSNIKLLFMYELIRFV